MVKDRIIRQCEQWNSCIDQLKDLTALLLYRKVLSQQTASEWASILRKYRIAITVYRNEELAQLTPPNQEGTNNE